MPALTLCSREPLYFPKGPENRIRSEMAWKRMDKSDAVKSSSLMPSQVNPKPDFFGVAPLCDCCQIGIQPIPEGWTDAYVYAMLASYAYQIHPDRLQYPTHAIGVSIRLYANRATTVHAIDADDRTRPAQASFMSWSWANRWARWLPIACSLKIGGANRVAVTSVVREDWRWRAGLAPSVG